MTSFWTTIAVGLVVIAAGIFLVIPQQIVTEPEIDLIAAMQDTPLQGVIRPQQMRAAFMSDELLDGSKTRPFGHLLPYRALQALFRYANECRGSVESADPVVAKTFLWHRYACGSVAELPDNFFRESPLMHPAGVSFAFLAYRHSSFFRQAGFPQLEGAFHLLEMQHVERLRNEFGTFGKLFSSLDAATATDLFFGTPVVRGRQFTFIRQDNTAIQRYLVYSNDAFERRLRQLSVRATKLHPFQSCEVRAGDLCLTVEQRPAISQLFLGGIFLLGGLLVIGPLGWHLRLRKRAYTKLQEDRKFVLELITHELRTPVAGLKLKIESLRQRFDSLAVADQDAVLGLIADAARLEKLVETSRQFLIVNPDRGRRLRKRRIGLAEMLADLTAKYLPETEIDLDISEDHHVYSDPYWLSLCIDNLLRNALTHGQAPFRIRSEPVARCRLSIIVQDSGYIASAAQLRDSRAANGQGLGLGLNIVRQMVKELGGRFGYKLGHNPCFYIQLERV